MIKKMLQIKGIKELKSSGLKVIHGGNDTNFCTDDLGNISTDCHRHVHSSGVPFGGLSEV